MRFVLLAIVSALRALRQSPLRSGLTALGICIGVAAVVLVVALGQGASRAVTAEVASLGENTITVRAEFSAQSGAKGAALARLTEEDARALARDVPGVAAVAPYVRTYGQAIAGQNNAQAELVGTTLEFFSIRDWVAETGSLWTESEGTTGARVCVLGDTAAHDLFDAEDPVGQTLRLGRHVFRVLGVLVAKGQGEHGRDQDASIFMPLRAMRATFAPSAVGQVDRIVLSAARRDLIEPVQEAASRLLRQRHRLDDGAPEDFAIDTQEDVRETKEGILTVLASTLLILAGISLLVGGIGVMNIMLVSVAERTREIGIRMAVGARERDILAQFLVESVVIALAGGLVGTGLAALVLHLAADALGWTLSVSGTALAVALVTSSVVGGAFGLFPARSAARLDPIHALRQE